jgi:hypothetical protein
MPAAVTSIDESQAVARLMRFLSVEGITGQEAAIGREVMKRRFRCPHRPAT